MLSAIALVSVLHNGVTIKEFYLATDISDKALNIALSMCKAQRKAHDICMLASERNSNTLVLTDLKNFQQIVLNK